LDSLHHNLSKSKADISLRYNLYPQLRKYKIMHIEIVKIYHLKQTIEIKHERISLIDSIKSRNDKAYIKMNREKMKRYNMFVQF
jgi:hypothetical protein